jgi:UDP-glucose 4-epimerase
MRFLITGGAGFIGAALANRLVEQKHHVRVLDDLSAGDSSRLDRRVVFTRGDVRDVPKLWTLLQGISCAFHLAARVSVPESVLYPREYNEVNVGGTVCLMQAARDAGVRRVILASSGAVYGDQETQPIQETAWPHPRSPYAVSKLASEQYVNTLGQLYDIETVSLRIFNAYGPGQFVPASHAPVIPFFLKQALSGGSVIVFGSGEQTRDFIYIDDVVDALVAATTAEGVNRRVINVGSGQETTVNQIVQTIARSIGQRVEPLYSRGDSGGVSRLVADVGLARQLLGFEPKVDMDTGLGRMLDRDPQLRQLFGRSG